MNSRIKTLLVGTASALVAGSLLIGCASTPPAEPTPPAAVAKPGIADEQVIRITAKVTAVDKKKRIVTLKLPDGRVAQVKCGPEVVNFNQIQRGDDVTAEFRDTIEIFIADTPQQPGADASAALGRAPKGQKPAGVAVKSVEVKARVDAIDYGTRQVRLVGPEGKTTTLKVGPEVKRLNEVKVGDTVVARYTEAAAIKVTTPPKAKK